MAKATAKGGAKLVSFDMNEGLVGSLAKKDSSQGAAPGELDEDIEVLKARKNQAVKADNVNSMFLENIGAITDSVNTFAQMQEQTIHNDPALLYQREKENYEIEI